MTTTQHIPTDAIRANVKAMAAYGMDEADICTILSISPDILREHYASDMAAGLPDAKLKVRLTLFQRATSGDVAAIRLWLELNAGGY